MSFEDKIKYQYMKILYEYLKINEIEEKLKISGVISKKIYDPDNIKISNYFFLKNDIILNRLNSNELNLLRKYMEQDIKYINSSYNVFYNEMNDFLFKNINKILLPTTDSKLVGYWSLSPNHLLPSDCICFYFHFKRNVEEYDKISEIICNIINYIQYFLSDKIGIKIAVIPCDETFNLKPKYL